MQDNADECASNEHLFWAIEDIREKAIGEARLYKKKQYILEYNFVQTTVYSLPIDSKTTLLYWTTPHHSQMPSVL
jgi:hypothetical protein